METVTRHRGARYDEDGKLTPASTTSLAATAIAPGGGGHNVERARDGRTVQCTVYFTTFVDLVNGDELNSIMENSPQIARMLAKHLNASVGDLKQLGKEGQISGQAQSRSET